MNKLIAFLLALFIATASPALAVAPSKLKNDLTITGALNVTGAVTLTTKLTAANANASVRRKLIYVPVVGTAGTLADSTTYKFYVPVGEIATLKKVSIIAATPPVGGTNTIKVLKASSSGNTMLGAASFDPTTLVTNVISAPALTATAADQAITAAQGIYVEWATGVQTTDGISCGILLELELTDYAG